MIKIRAWQKSAKENGSSPFSNLRGHSSKGLWEFERIPAGGELCLLYRPMARNIKRYYQAWELRQQKLTFKEIGKIMKITGSRAAVLSNFVDFKIKYQKRWRISDELKELIKKYCR
ncbi:hypothetical protein COS51_00120 [Candidatus Roizmanbacteria bacterium CG03_land_8_20_14_0_80_36_21]|nr:MAG: hypothetical protein COS51_00120 [Candidatus Roizmanbacteria bacterium CG03_land_8_20_14_0_80_36_21]